MNIHYPEYRDGRNRHVLPAFCINIFKPSCSVLHFNNYSFNSNCALISTSSSFSNHLRCILLCSSFLLVIIKRPWLRVENSSCFRFAICLSCFYLLFVFFFSKVIFELWKSILKFKHFPGEGKESGSMQANCLIYRKTKLKLVNTSFTYQEFEYRIIIWIKLFVNCIALMHLLKFMEMEYHNKAGNFQKYPPADHPADNSNSSQ